jgi:integrase
VSARVHRSGRHHRGRRRLSLPHRSPQDRPADNQPLSQQDAHRIIRRRAKAAGIETRIGNHTFRATGITAYLKNSGKLEVAQQNANHESPRTTKLYDRRQDEISLDEIERITI